MQRREFFKKMGIAAAASVAVPAVSFADDKPKSPNEMSYNTALQAITGGKTPIKSSNLKLKAPEIAENGAVVPVTVTVDSPMTSDNYVKSIHVLASKNANVRCTDVHLSPANGKAMLATRIKLGSTQDVVVIAKISNGDIYIASQNVKVTIGGCG